MKTLCCSVRLESLTAISDRCYKARSFDGSEDLIPVSQIFGQDFDVGKSDAYWISQWVLEKKKIQWSEKKTAWFDSATRQLLYTGKTIEKHVPERITEKPESDESLFR